MARSSLRVPPLRARAAVRPSYMGPPKPVQERKCNCQWCPICGKIRCRRHTGSHPDHRGYWSLGNGVGQIEVCKLSDDPCTCHGAA